MLVSSASARISQTNKSISSYHRSRPSWEMPRPIRQALFREHHSRSLFCNFHRLWCWLVLPSKGCGNISDLQCLVLFIFMAVSAAKNCESFACPLVGGSCPYLSTWDQFRSGLRTHDLVYRNGQLDSLLIAGHPLILFCLGFIYYIYVFSTYPFLHSSFTPCWVDVSFSYSQVSASSLSLSPVLPAPAILCSLIEKLLHCESPLSFRIFLRKSWCNVLPSIW
jgi:hypothetical protein